MKRSIHGGLLISVLIISACGRASLQDQGMAINPTGKAAAAKSQGKKQSAVAKSAPAQEDDDDKLPPEAQQEKAKQIVPPPPHVDPSTPKANEAPLSAEEQMDIEAMWDGKVASADEWTRYTAEAVDMYGQDLVATQPSDGTVYCARWNQLSKNERKAFYVALISGIASLENTKFDPEVVYVESFRDSKGRRIRSTGLLQISLESGNYYGCGFKTEDDVQDPRQNLACGVKILNKWIANDRRIAGRGKGWLGGSRYWAVLRTERKLKVIRSGMNQLSFCGAPTNSAKATAPATPTASKKK